MSNSPVFAPGNYRFVPGVFQYSAGVAAEPGYRIERVRFMKFVSLAEGFRLIEQVLKAAGRPLTAFCACELRSPKPFDEHGFEVFNKEYVGTLARWGLFDGKTNLDKIETAIAAIGYDTEHKTATNASYDALHECCKYDRASTQVAEIKKVTLVAAGLTCSMCSKAIFKALSKLDFVEEVKVDIEKSMYILTFKNGKKVEVDQIKTAVTDAGFSVQSLVSE